MGYSIIEDDKHGGPEMIDFKLLKLTDEDEIRIGSELDNIVEENSANRRLLQKVIIMFKQEAGSNAFYDSGYSLFSVINKKLDPSRINEIKVKLHYLIQKMQKDIVAEQERYPDELDGMLEKIDVVDIDVDKDGSAWKVSIFVYDKAGGKTYMRV